MGYFRHSGGIFLRDISRIVAVSIGCKKGNGRHNGPLKAIPSLKSIRYLVMNLDIGTEDPQVEYHVTKIKNNVQCNANHDSLRNIG